MPSPRITTEPQPFVSEGNGQQTKKSIESLILSICNAAGDLQREIKIHMKETRALNRSDRELTTTAKIQVQLRTGSYILEGFGTAAQVGSAFAGGGLLGGLLQGVAQGLTHTASQRERANSAETTGHDYSLHRTDRQENEYTQEIQGAGNRSDQMHAMVDRVMQSSQSVFQSLAAAAA